MTNPYYLEFLHFVILWALGRNVCVTRTFWEVTGFIANLRTRTTFYRDAKHLSQATAYVDHSHRQSLALTRRLPGSCHGFLARDCTDLNKQVLCQSTKQVKTGRLSSKSLHQDILFYRARGGDPFWAVWDARPRLYRCATMASAISKSKRHLNLPFRWKKTHPYDQMNISWVPRDVKCETRSLIPFWQSRSCQTRRDGRGSFLQHHLSWQSRGSIEWKEEGLSKYIKILGRNG